MRKFKGYQILGSYPADGWIKGYFYAIRDDTSNSQEKTDSCYRDLGAIRHKDYCLRLLDIKTGEKVLDAGCANGAMMVYCGLLGAEVYGVDISKDAVSDANGYVAKFGLKGKAVLADAGKTGFADGFFDKAISSDFFEHLDYPQKIKVLEEIKRVLKPGGSLVIKTPNLTYLRFSKLIKQVMSLIMLKNPLRIVIAHTEGKNPQHIGLTGRRELSGAIFAAGFDDHKFCFDVNSKVVRFNRSLAGLLARIPLLRDIFCEELIIVAYKPIILSLFP